MAGERQIPVAISLKFTDKVAEVKMEHRGQSLMQFMRNHNLSQAELYVFAFEMGIQLLQALKVIHQAGYVHSDMKPDNICVRELS